MSIELVPPTATHLPTYVAALERGWSPDNTLGGEATRVAQLVRIAGDPAAFLAGMDDPEGLAGDVILPDGTAVKRLPGIVRWLWDGEFCGAINFRWQVGSEALPAYVLGHVGYAVVPWKQRRGHATRALALMLPEARLRGLRWIEITTQADNLPSQKVILANGDVLMERFEQPAAYGAGEGLRWRLAV